MRSHTFSIQIFCGSVVFMLQLANPHPHAGRSWTSAGLPSKRIPFRFPNLNLDRGDAEPREAEKAQQELGGELFGVLRIRGGEKPDKERKTPIYEQLREAEELFQKGVLSEEEFSKERGRLVVELATGSMNECDNYESESSDEDEDPELYMNFTLGRLANNAIAKRQGWGARDTVDPMARGMRWDKTIGFSDEEKETLARAALRIEREEQLGLDQNDADFGIDRRRLWATAAQALFRNLTAASGPGEPLTDVSFRAKKDLEVGEVVSVALLNFTGPPEPVPFSVTCSPVGKIKRAVWMSRCKVLNLTVVSSIFQDEPITVFLPSSCNVTVDTRRVAMQPGDFLQQLFNNSGILPHLPPHLVTNDTQPTAPEPPPPIARGKVMRIKGLGGAKKYNGYHASILGISCTRYQVQLIETGKKLLVAPANLEEIQGKSAAEQMRDEAARDAWELVDSLHRGVPERQNASSANTSDAAGWDGPKQLDDDDIRELAALNISLGDDTVSPFRAISHLDGGFGRQIFHMDGRDAEEKRDEDSLRETAKARSAKHVILDLHLQRACIDGNADRVAELIEAGASTATTRLPGSPHGEFKRTPLHIAAWECQREVVEVLLHKGADVHALDANNATALHHAAVKGDHDIVHLLLDSGADPCQVNAFNRSSIHRAVFYGHAAVAQTLLANAGSRYNLEEISEISNLGAIPLSRIPELRTYD